MNYKDYYNNKEVYGPSKQRIANILQLLGNISGLKILDLACGNGEMASALKNRGAIMTCCDISQRAINLCKKEIDDSFVFDVEKDDFSVFNKKFDIIIASELIEHLFDPESFLRKIKDCMKEGVVLVLTTPNFLMWTNRIKILFGKFEYTKTGFLDEGHIHFFSFDSLRGAIGRAGLKIIEENNIIHPKIPHWLGNLLPNLFVYQIIFKVKL